MKNKLLRLFLILMLVLIGISIGFGQSGFYQTSTTPVDTAFQVYVKIGSTETGYDTTTFTGLTSPFTSRGPYWSNQSYRNPKVNQSRVANNNGSFNIVPWNTGVTAGTNKYIRFFQGDNSPKFRFYNKDTLFLTFASGNSNYRARFQFDSSQAVRIYTAGAGNLAFTNYLPVLHVLRFKPSYNETGETFPTITAWPNGDSLGGAAPGPFFATNQVRVATANGYNTGVFPRNDAAGLARGARSLTNYGGTTIDNNTVDVRGFNPDTIMIVFDSVINTTSTEFQNIYISNLYVQSIDSMLQGRSSGVSDTLMAAVGRGPNAYNPGGGVDTRNSRAPGVIQQGANWCMYQPTSGRFTFRSGINEVGATPVIKFTLLPGAAAFVRWNVGFDPNDCWTGYEYRRYRIAANGSLIPTQRRQHYRTRKNASSLECGYISPDSLAFRASDTCTIVDSGYTVPAQRIRDTIYIFDADSNITVDTVGSSTVIDNLLAPGGLTALDSALSNSVIFPNSSVKTYLTTISPRGRLVIDWQMTNIQGRNYYAGYRLTKVRLSTNLTGIQNDTLNGSTPLTHSTAPAYSSGCLAHFSQGGSFTNATAISAFGSASDYKDTCILFRAARPSKIDIYYRADTNITSGTGWTLWNTDIPMTNAAVLGSQTNPYSFKFVVKDTFNNLVDKAIVGIKADVNTIVWDSNYRNVTTNPRTQYYGFGSRRYLGPDGVLQPATSIPGTTTLNLSVRNDSRDVNMGAVTAYSNNYDDAGVAGAHMKFTNYNDCLTGINFTAYLYREHDTSEAVPYSVWKFYSLTVSGTEISTPTLSSPVNGTNGVSLNPTLSWNSVVGATSYRLQISTSSTFSPTIIDDASLTGLSYNINNLSSNTIYYWRVSARKNTIQSDWSVIYNFSTYTNAPNDYWTQINNGLKSYNITSLFIKSRDLILAGVDNGSPNSRIYYSTNDGNDWQQCAILNGSSMNPTYGFCLNANNQIIAASNCYLYFSSDNGLSWSSVNYSFVFNSIIKNVDNYIFFGDNSGNIYRSIDNGLNLVKVFSLPANVKCLINNSNGNIFAGTEGNGIYKSIDNGNTWTQINNGLTSNNIYSFAIDKDGNIYAGSYNYIFRSSNNGLNWSGSVTSSGYAKSLTYNSKGHLFLGSSSRGVYRSIDNGNTWIQINSGLMNNLNITSLVIDSNDFLYAGSFSGGIFKSRFSTVLPSIFSVSPLNNSPEITINPTFSWKSVTGAAGYSLLVSLDSNFSNNVINQNSITDTFYNASGLQSNKIYYWKVQASNPSAVSDYSDRWSFSTIAGIPDQPSLSSPSNGATNTDTNLTLTWNSVMGATSYIVQVSTINNFANFVYNDSSITTTSKGITGLQNGTTYYWRVSAKNSVGIGAWSTTYNFSTVSSGVTVWPGDNNNDGIVNQADILPLGLYWAATGSTRLSASTAWTGQSCQPWSPINVTYADANGDGVVNQADILPIGLNWNKTHSVLLRMAENSKNLKKSESGPNITVKVPFDIQANKEFYVEINIGNVNKTTKNLLGVAFELNYPKDTLEILEILPGNLLGDDILMFPNIDQTNGKLSAGVTRKNGQGEAKGYETLVRIKAKLKNADAKLIKVSFENVVAMDPNGAEISLNSENANIILGSKDKMNQPSSFNLYQNHPNPFNPSTMIRYSLAEECVVSLKVLDALGREVRTLVCQNQISGEYEVSFDAKDLPSGFYIYHLQAGQYVQNRKMLLLK